jgi:hypothetical protein
MMSDGSLEFWKKPESEEIFLIAGWRQWADAGSVSSGLLNYWIQRQRAELIGQIKPDGFYLFQIPGTHDLVRPEIKLQDGYPEQLITPRNEFYYAGDARRGVVFFLGDEPHLDAEQYVSAFLQAAEMLRVKRIVGFGGVYGELPYEKERMVSAIFSLPGLRAEISQYAVNLSNYHGGASIESYICKRAGDRNQEFVALYAFVPAFDFSSISSIEKSIRIENDFMAWLGVMQRVKHMLKFDFDLVDLEEKSRHLIDVMNAEVDEIEKSNPQFNVRAYFRQLEENFTETPFTPLDGFWEEKLKGLFDKLGSEDEPDE